MVLYNRMANGNDVYIECVEPLMAIETNQMKKIKMTISQYNVYNNNNNSNIVTFSISCVRCRVVVKQLTTMKELQPASPSAANGPAAATSVSGTGKLRFQMLTKHVILYCGSQRGTLDQVSLALFPFCFVVFSIIYWISYITESLARFEFNRL